MIIAVDFDGTCVTHEYPRVGRDIGAVPVLQDLVAEEHKLILWTMRSKQHLLHAVEWFDNNQIPLWAVNENPEQIVWTRSPKAFAELYIDDAALGAPLIQSRKGERDFIDWVAVRFTLKVKGAL